MNHRGPDGEGLLMEANIALAHRRLAIIDLAGGAQPIFNQDRTLAIVFNGEIYNYRELTERLQTRFPFRTRSDTEAILHLYEEMGTGCVDHLQGMFAFAIADLREGSCFIARDRTGKKPLYYWQENGRLAFASEIKSLLALPMISREPDPVAIDGYLSMRYVPGPRTMFKNIWKLSAGHWMLWKDGRATIQRYWSPPFLAQFGERPDSWYEEQFEHLFQEAIKLRMVGDVPVGAFLSGGLDSSCIVAEMATQTKNRISTFSVGFDWEGDELKQAAKTAELLGCDHHEIVCRSEHMSLLPEIVWHSDEPIGDAIAVPTYLLAREASKSVKVVLSGDGADESLGGYVFHKIILLANALNHPTMVPVLRHLINPIVKFLPLRLLNFFFDYPGQLDESGKLKLLAFLKAIPIGDPAANYRLLISLFDTWDKERLFTESFNSDIACQQSWLTPTREKDLDFLSSLLAVQFQDWLPDNVLARQDKMTMAHGLEARSPFLDHKLIEFLGTVPPHLKIKQMRKNKYLLRQHAKKVLPATIANRRKKPFYIPVERYFADSSFKQLIRDTLNPDSVRLRGYFRQDAISKIVEGVGQDNFLEAKRVTALVMLELWHQLFIDGRRPVLYRPPPHPHS